MTINTDDTGVYEFAYAGVGPYTFEFRCDDVSWFKLFVNSAEYDADDHGTLTLNPDQVANPGGSYTFDGGLASTGDPIEFRRVLPLQQTLDLGPYQAFPAEQLETALDHIVMMLKTIDSGGGGGVSSGLGGIGRIFNVRDYGARADRVTDCDPAFRTAASLCTNPNDIILVPSGLDDDANPYYYLPTADYLGYLATPDGTGGVTLLRNGLLVGDTLITVGRHLITAGGPSAPTDNASGAGAFIRAANSFAGTGDIVQIGRRVGELGWAGPADEAADGSMLDGIRIAGDGFTFDPTHRRTGVKSYGAQERSGLRRCIVSSCYNGIDFAAGTGITPSNFIIDDTDVWGGKVTGFGMRLASGGGGGRVSNPTVVKRDNASAGTVITVSDSGGFFLCTTAGAHGLESGDIIKIGGHAAINGRKVVTYVSPTTFTIDTAYVATSGTIKYWQSGRVGIEIIGSGIVVTQPHIENYEVGLAIGPSSGAGSPLCNGAEISHPSGHNELQFAPMDCIVDIRNTLGHSWGHKISQWYSYGAQPPTVAIRDRLQGVTVPTTPPLAAGATYEVHGTYGVNSDVAYSNRPVLTSLFRDHTTVNVTSDQHDYVLGNTGVLIIGAGTTGAYQFTGFAGGFAGRVLIVVNNSSYPQRLMNNTTSSAGNRIRPIQNNITSATNLTLMPGEIAELRFGIGPSTTQWGAYKLLASSGPSMAMLYKTPSFVTADTVVGAGVDTVLTGFGSNTTIGPGITVSGNRATIVNGNSGKVYHLKANLDLEFSAGGNFVAKFVKNFATTPVDLTGARISRVVAAGGSRHYVMELYQVLNMTETVDVVVNHSAGATISLHYGGWEIASVSN